MLPVKSLGATGTLYVNKLFMFTLYIPNGTSALKSAGILELHIPALLETLNVSSLLCFALSAIGLF